MRKPCGPNADRSFPRLARELRRSYQAAAQGLLGSCPGMPRSKCRRARSGNFRNDGEPHAQPASQPASQPAPAEGWVKRGGGGRWGRELGRREKGERREGVRTNNSVLGGHPDTRAESMISTSLEQISAAQRIDGLPWVDLGVGGWPAERQQRVWETNMRQTCAPLARKCVKSADPEAESRRRIEGRPRGVAVGGCQKCAPFVRKCVDNTHP